MNRILLAFILGLVVPILWFVLCYAVTQFVFIPGLTDIRIYGKIAPGLLWAPIAVPSYLVILLRMYGMQQPSLDFYSEMAILILFNWALYGTIFYLLLGKLKRFQKQTASTLPPSPSVFDS